ncbi:17098_t:CDS:2 [Funneliformis geosporum]|uniref:17098_t:CDS:1 n=1 Tax=Funneliformis geosporum TaxID=1117311 RepID=A0A9W4WHU8_9GLOM|nr:17098_t:CDS:2 [Funneliformis geosporum]
MSTKANTIYFLILFLFIIDCRAFTDNADNAEKFDAILGQDFKRSTINERLGDDKKFKRDGLLNDVIFTESKAEYSPRKRQINNTGNNNDNNNGNNNGNNNENNNNNNNGNNNGNNSNNNSGNNSNNTNENIDNDTCNNIGNVGNSKGGCNQGTIVSAGTRVYLKDTGLIFGAMTSVISVGFLILA